MGSSLEACHAPRARQMPISARRSATDTSLILMIPIPPTIGEMLPTAPRPTSRPAKRNFPRADTRNGSGRAGEVELRGKFGSHNRGISYRHIRSRRPTSPARRNVYPQRLRPVTLYD